jgi:ABC-type transporter Mla maintaining outer membrane lipid asymmetry ATPase subunit MlaF
MSEFILEVNELKGATRFSNISEVAPLNFSLKSGEIGVALGGRGPSQLWRLLYGKGEVAQGSINFGGDIKVVDDISWRAQIGFVHRDKGLLSNLSMYENVALPAKYHARNIDNIERVLKEVNIDQKFWNKRPSEVSWKVRKQTLMARSTVLAPKLLLMDDPTELYPYLDYHELYHWIKLQAQKGIAILIGTEEVPFALCIADWVIDQKTNKVVQNFDEIYSSDLIKAAANLKEVINKQHGSNDEI